MELLIRETRKDPALYDVSGCAGLTDVKLAEQLLSLSSKLRKTKCSSIVIGATIALGSSLRGLTTFVATLRDTR